MPHKKCNIANPENANQHRSKWAEKALRAFAKQTGQSVKHDGWPEITGDFMADFAHFCDRHDLELMNLVAVASRHYEEETAPEDESKKVRGTQFDGLA
jgi:hypothetical protein